MGTKSNNRTRNTNVMSVIAVRKYKEKIVLAGDLQTSWGDSKLVDAKNQMFLDPSKLWKHNGLVVGGAGYVSVSTMFRIFTKTRKPTTCSVEGILEFLVEFVEWAKKKDTNFKLENHFIIIYEGKIFQTIEYEVREVPEYNAVGSGMFLALGAMYKGADPEEAVEVAKQFDLFCSGSTDVITVPLKHANKHTHDDN